MPSSDHCIYRGGCSEVLMAVVILSPSQTGLNISFFFFVQWLPLEDSISCYELDHSILEKMYDDSRTLYAPLRIHPTSTKSTLLEVPIHTSTSQLNITSSRKRRQTLPSSFCTQTDRV